MKILGIETSCDDTGIAVLEVREGGHPRFSILSNIVASQIAVHQEYGGVFPSLAKREHIKSLPRTLEKALQEAGMENTRSRSFDAVAVTYGPGLSPCLWTGINVAKDLAKRWRVPLVPVDHMEGHLLAGLLMQSRENSKSEFLISKRFPAVALVVSGGHTQLALVKDIGKYEMLGETRDDAAGECFDKTARILGLPYPGGPAIAAEAAKTRNPKHEIFASPAGRRNKLKISLPRPMMRTKDYDFSFSGLKTAVLYDYKGRPQEVRESKEYIQEMAVEIQQAIVDVLVHKTTRAAKEFGAKSVVLGGGVAANDELRKQFSHILHIQYHIPLLAPPKNLSTDNGFMIALAGYFTYKRGDYPKNPETTEALSAAPNLRLASCLL